MIMRLQMHEGAIGYASVCGFHAGVNISHCLKAVDTDSDKIILPGIRRIKD
jgi:hypothetical protein